MSGALDGVRVVDLTAVLMGPFATQLLGDMGADVIKIEPPSGDTSRWIGGGKTPGMGGGFLHVNRNKRGVVLDLKNPAGHAALLKLVETADVLVYNVRPQAMARLKLTYDDLAKINPRLIYVGVFGYGQDGPYAAQPAYDDLIQGVLGLPSLVASVGDGVPRYVPLAFVDRTVGLAAVNAVCAALYRREKSGVGQRIDVPMFETMVPVMLGEHMGGATFSPAVGKPGYPRLLARERTPFPTSDGYVCALIYNDKHWRNFFKMIGKPEGYEADPRLVDIGQRTIHIADLYGMVAEVMRTDTTENWLRRLDEADIPATKLHTLESLMEDPHLKAVDYFKVHEHPSEGPIVQMESGSSWSESPPEIRRLAPKLGQHSAEVLREIGFDDAAIQQLAESGATRLGSV